MMDLTDALVRLFDWFHQSFEEQTSKCKSIQCANNDFKEMLDDMSTRRNMTADDVYDIEDGVLDMVTATQELAYIRGVGDGAQLLMALHPEKFPRKGAYRIRRSNSR